MLCWCSAPYDAGRLDRCCGICDLWVGLDGTAPGRGPNALSALPWVLTQPMPLPGVITALYPPMGPNTTHAPPRGPNAPSCIIDQRERVMRQTQWCRFDPPWRRGPWCAVARAAGRLRIARKCEIWGWYVFTPVTRIKIWSWWRQRFGGWSLDVCISWYC